jgi:hypothetical protein
MNAQQLRVSVRDKRKEKKKERKEEEARALPTCAVGPCNETTTVASTACNESWKTAKSECWSCFV